VIIDFTVPRILVIDFSPRVFLRARTHAYLLIREVNGRGQFLTLESGSIEVINVTKEEDGFRVYTHSDGESDKAYIGHLLAPYRYDFMKAIRSLHEGTLGRSALADRELRNILGLKPSETKLEAGTACSLADICIELSVDPTEARKLLRTSGVEKPGARWEWELPSDVNEIRELLRGLQSS